MFKNTLIRLAITSVFVIALRWAGAQNGATSGLYQIVSGEFTACCGIAGPFRFALPNEEQSFVRLTVEGRSATMTFLGQDMETVFSVEPCPIGGPIDFSFDNGLVMSNSIVFRGGPLRPPSPTSWSYTVSNSADSLRINGTLNTPRIGCADVPTEFSHSNVVAVLMPIVSIRISEVEVCWTSVSNRNYQVQYRSTLTTNAWTNLGSLVTGSGATTCITDKVPLGQPQRFYRVLPVPGPTPVRLLKR